MAELKLVDLARRIGEHLKRFEGDPVISRREDGKTARFWNTACVVNGRFLAVTYISYQSNSNMTKSEGVAYLAKLDSGYVGRHFEALRELAAVGETK